jgi:hypothetical protein
VSRAQAIAVIRCGVKAFAADIGGLGQIGSSSVSELTA